MVGRGLHRLHPAVKVDYFWVESQGDTVTDRSLAAEGGKGLFTAAIDRAVLDGKADLAVHSFKDVPVEATPGLALAATPRRADVHDCQFTSEGVASIDALPHGAVVGTSSYRRAAQLRRRRADLALHLIRGNVETRLRKVLGDAAGVGDAALGPPRYDATLLAVAGLTRLRLAHHAERVLDVETMMPAASQAAMALFCRCDDHVTLTRCLPLNNAATSTAVHAERQFVQQLGADCDAAIAALAEPVPPPDGEPVRNADAHWFRFRGRVFAPDGSAMLEADETVRTRDLPRLVKRVAADLAKQGARELLERARGESTVIGPLPHRGPTDPAAHAASTQAQPAGS